MVLLASERPSDLRTILLAYPTRRTRKYVPPKYKPPKQRSKPVEPIDNWRLSMLALPTPFKTTPKYVFIPEPGCGSGVSPGTLTGSGTSRTNDLSVQTIRYLTQARLACQHLGGRVVKNLDKTIKQSWNTIYNYYARQLDEKRKKLEAKRHRILQEQNKGIKPKTPAEIQAEIDKRIADWTAVKALPKRTFSPPPISRGKVVKLDVIRMRMDQMAEPTRITAKYIRPSIDPTYVDPLSVKPGAKKYVASERVVELSRNPAFKLIKLPEIIPGAVKRGALKGPISPRCDELATPKKKAAEKDTDLKENPFEISPLALKAKATPRVLELSKPIQR